MEGGYKFFGPKLIFLAPLGPKNRPSVYVRNLYILLGKYLL